MYIMHSFVLFCCDYLCQLQNRNVCIYVTNRNNIESQRQVNDMVLCQCLIILVLFVFFQNKDIENKDALTVLFYFYAAKTPSFRFVIINISL